MPAQEKLRIVSIETECLFNLYSHKINLNAEQRLTIVHGQNGVGKTVILRLVAAFFEGRYYEFLKYPFKAFTIMLSDGRMIKLELLKPVSKKGRTNRNLKVSISVAGTSNVDVQSFDLEIGDAAWLARKIERKVSWLTSIDRDTWLDRRDGMTLTADEVVSSYSQYVDGKESGFSLGNGKLVDKIRMAISTHLIETQRLLNVSYPDLSIFPPVSRRYSPPVKMYASELQRSISDSLAAYAKESQNLDQSFPQRLLQNPSVPLLPDVLKVSLRELHQKRTQLKDIGLIDDDPQPAFDEESLNRISPEQLGMMTLYADDTARKLGTLDDIATRINLLLETINRKYKHKKLSVNREKGLVIKGDSGEELGLDALSSGEQHELVLLYDLLFKVSENTLIMIDEPELSLHVDWQQQFLDDLLAIIENRKFDVLIATHSPYIVEDKHHLMVPLSSERDEQCR